MKLLAGVFEGDTYGKCRRDSQQIEINIWFYYEKRRTLAQARAAWKRQSGMFSCYCFGPKLTFFTGWCVNRSEHCSKKKQNADMEEKDGGNSIHLLDLDHEILSFIIGFIETLLLFPSCFLTCKSLLRAAMDERTWQRRCFDDLNIIEPSIEDEIQLSWIQTYRGLLPHNSHYPPPPPSLHSFPFHFPLPYYSPFTILSTLLFLSSCQFSCLHEECWNSWDPKFRTLPPDERQQVKEELQGKGINVRRAGHYPSDILFTSGPDQNLWIKGPSIVWKEPRP